ncbi:MAG: hypothetical protein AAF333_11340 [Planctomycetota bacterium]
MRPADSRKHPRKNLRINVIGTSGAGKTTLARRLGERLGVPHVELDALNWGPNWTERPNEEFRARIAAFIAGESWVMCGNYTRVRPMLTERVNVFVWLDYPRWRVTWRVVCRTIRRVWTREELWSGNRESFRMSFLSRDSIIWWSIKNFRKNRRRKYPALFAELADRDDIETVRLRSPRETEKWLTSITAAPEA